MGKQARLYPPYEAFSREKEFRKSDRAAIVFVCLVSALLIALHALSFSTEILMPAGLESSSAFLPVSENVPELKNVPPPLARKLMTAESDFKIYSVPPIKEKKAEEAIPPPEPPPSVIKKKEPEKETAKSKVKIEEPQAEYVSPIAKENYGDNPEAAAVPSFGGSEAAAEIEGDPKGASPEADIKQTAAAKILLKMERYKKYPRQARRIGAEGLAKIIFSVDASGLVAGVSLKDSSGHSMLDRAAMAAAEKIVGLDVAGGKGHNGSFSIVVPVEFTLTR